MALSSALARAATALSQIPNPDSAIPQKQKSPDMPGFLLLQMRTDYSATSSATAGRSTSSTYAIGALSPARKPHLRMRR